MRSSLEYWIRYAQTVRHLKPIQVWGRVFAVLKQRMVGHALPAVPSALHPIPFSGIEQTSHDPWNSREDILQGTFTFLNDTHSLGEVVNWHAEETPLLWRFNLHYFHYIHLLELEEQVRMCQAWINAHPPGTPVAWHPYPTSLRLVNWCRTRMRERRILESMYLQAGHLYRNIEYHITGNHVIENARALIVAGHFFNQQGEAKAWFAKGVALILSEIQEQVLADGGHYERSPMYHALMLECFLDVLDVLPATHYARSTLLPAIKRMADFLASLTHPDGNLVLFNDSTRDIAPAPSDLIERVHNLTGHVAETKNTYEETGYYLFRGRDIFLALDAGPVGPDHLMAHAHADIFSYELSLSGVQFIVDAGVYEYQKGAMREYVRSTRAHNTVCVDEQDQVECWDSFRVGRRWAPNNIVFANKGQQCRFDGIFDGYAHQLGDRIMHRRKLTVDEGARTFNVVDSIEGEGRHRVESLIHVHPAVHIEEIEGHFVLQHEGVSCQLTTHAPEVKIEAGWYCPKFGTRLSNMVIVLGGEVELPVQFSYTLRY